VSSNRETIMQSLLDAIIVTDGINGAVDDLPPLNYAESPPMPRPGYGEARRPFAFVFEGEEQPEADAYMAQYVCNLPVTVELVYDFSRSDAANGCKRKGRELLGRMQAALMVDPNRTQRAQNTVETFNAVEEAVPEENIGVAVWRGVVTYVRSRSDPNSLEATLP
jgi:hypothetical protein